MGGLNQIQDPSLNQFLQRRLNVQEPGPAGSLAPEIFPVLSVLDPSIEDDYLRSVRVCASYQFSGAVAGEYSGIRLRNPLGSNILVVVDMMMVKWSNALYLYGGVRETDADLLTGTPLTGSRDTRWPGSTNILQNASIATVTSGSDAVQPFTVDGKIIQAWLGPNLSTQMTALGVVLKPGTAWDLWGSTVTEPIYASFRWRERRVNPSELL